MRQEAQPLGANAHQLVMYIEDNGIEIVVRVRLVYKVSCTFNERDPMRQYGERTALIRLVLQSSRLT
jgi:hypothetical protein